MLLSSGFAPIALLGIGTGLIVTIGLALVFRRHARRLANQALPEPSHDKKPRTTPLNMASVIGVAGAGVISLIWGEPGELFGIMILGVMGTAFFGWMFVDMIRHNRRLAQQQDERGRPRRESSERWRS